MKITKSKLHGWSACNDGYEWFLRRFPDGEADYQDVLNALVEDGQLSYAHWLINHAGPDCDAVLEVDGIADCKNFFAAGRLVIKTRATVTGWLRAGLGIEAGEGIEAGFSIVAKFLSVRLRIFAGLVAWRLPEPSECEVRAEIRSGTLAHGTHVAPVEVKS